MLIPSIDLFDGKAVQWRKGAEPVLEREDVFELLDEFSLYGEVAVIDLNAATGKGDNKALIKQMLQRKAVRVGGGIRDLDTAREYIKAGASKIIIGTAAGEPWVKKLPREALIFAIDSRGDFITSHGWQETTDTKTETALAAMADGCSEFLYTQVEKEGMMQGLDRERVGRVVEASPVPVTVAGGITTLDDIAYLNKLGANGQIGMAIYTGSMKLDEAFMVACDFEKAPLMPTVVQDVDSGDVLMLAYSNKESLAQALKERRGLYWSRSRSQLWRKGDTSGHIQELVQADIDCDGDTLLFKVKQTGPACHLDRWSCFPSVRKQFGLDTLDKTLASRLAQLPEGSFTTKLFKDADFRAAKLREETEELIEAEDFEHARWEAADLLYFALVNARAKGVSLENIVSELRSRHGN